MTTRSAATLIRAFAAVRGLLYATGFVALWWWVVASVRPLDSRFTLELPAWLRVPGLILAALGVVLALSCIAAFALVGKGTPAPFDPPREFVAVGPYRWVRNPMYLGAVAVICGAGLYLRSLGAIVGRRVLHPARARVRAALRRAEPRGTLRRKLRALQEVGAALAAAASGRQRG